MIFTGGGGGGGGVLPTQLDSFSLIMSSCFFPVPVIELGVAF